MADYTWQQALVKVVEIAAIAYVVKGFFGMLLARKIAGKF